MRIEVDNNNFLDVDVYAVLGGQSFRIGTVVGKTSGTLQIEESRINPSWGLQLRAEPVGSNESFLTYSLPVGPGSIVVFEIAAELSMSQAYLRG